MHPYRKQRILGAVFLGAIAVSSFVGVKPAQAFTWDKNSVTFDLTDVGSTVDIFYFDGTIGGEVIDGLTSKLSLTLTQFTGKTADLTGTVYNTMDPKAFSTGRVTGIAFNVDPDVKSVTSSGLFTKTNLNRIYPEGVGKVEVCYGSNGNNCNGNQGGVPIFDGNGNPGVGTFATTLTWQKSLPTFTLSDFYARYQGINSGTLNGASGVGYGTVPTPAMLPGLIGMGIAAWRKKKKQNREEQASSSLI